MGSVSEHHVEKNHSNRQIASGLFQTLQPEPLVDHRMGPAAGIGILSVVDDGVTVGPFLLADLPQGDGGQTGRFAAQAAARKQTSKDSGPVTFVGGRP